MNSDFGDKVILSSNIWVSVTPSDNSFTISPHSLAFLHSTLLHSCLAAIIPYTKSSDITFVT